MTNHPDPSNSETTVFGQLDPHIKRWITGVLLAIPLFALLFIGPLWSWLILIALGSAIGLWESQFLLFSEGLSYRWQAFYIAVGLLFPLGAFFGGVNGLHLVLVLSLFCGFLALLALYPFPYDGISCLSRFVLSWLYIPYLLSYVLILGAMENARASVVFVLVVTIGADAGAFYSGRRWGRHKLYEKVSPKKTVEGALGGLLLSVLTGTVFGHFFLTEVPVLKLIVVILMVALVGQVGDLIESMIKRISGKKDSSRLLPGHGGLLDRLDSLLFAFPTAWFFLSG